MLKIVWNNFSVSPWMECMLKIVWNNFSVSPWMECMLKIVFVTWMLLSRAMHGAIAEEQVQCISRDGVAENCSCIFRTPHI